MMVNLIKRMLLSVGWHVSVVILTFVTVRTRDDNYEGLWQAYLQAHIAAITLALFVVVSLTTVAVFYVEVALHREPWRLQWSPKWLVLAIVGGLFAALLGIAEAIQVGSDWRGVAAPLLVAPWTRQVLTALLVIFIVGLPTTWYLETVWRLHELRRAYAALNQLDKRYLEHLTYLLPWRETVAPVRDVLVPDPDALFELSVTGGAASAQGGNGSAEPQEPESSQEPLPGLSMLWNAYHNAKGRLLVHGDAGGGKSTQAILLGRELTRQALASITQGVPRQAQVDRNTLMSVRFPIMLDLSTWITDPRSVASVGFETWLVRAIAAACGIDMQRAQTWLDGGRCVFLLDGFDVLPEAMRKRCIGEINALLTREDQALVVCTRKEPYDATPGPRLQLKSVTIEKLDEKKVVKPALATVGKAALLRDPNKQERLRSPMMLSLELMRSDPPYVVGDAPDQSMGARTWEGELACGYVQRMLLAAGRSNQEIDTIEQAMAWLGNELKVHSRLSFSVKEMQRDVLPPGVARRQYRVLLAGLIVLIKVLVALLLAVALAQVIIAVYSIGHGAAIKQLFESSPVGQVGSVLGLTMALIGGLGVGMGIGWAIDFAKEILFSTATEPTARGKGRALMVAITIALLVGVVIELVGGSDVGWIGSVLGAIVAGVVVGVIIGVGGGLQGDRGADWPDDGIGGSARGALAALGTFVGIGALVGGLLGGISVGVVVWEALGLRDGIEYGLEASLIGGITGALLLGLFLGVDAALGREGAAVVQNVMLRRVLANRKVVPPNFVEVLRRARASGVLRRDGSGYTFIVRSEMLRDMLAAEYTRTHAEQSDAGERQTRRCVRRK